MATPPDRGPTPGAPEPPPRPPTVPPHQQSGPYSNWPGYPPYRARPARINGMAVAALVLASLGSSGSAVPSRWASDT